MGGVGSGGRRVGAGRKPKDAVLRALDGNAGKRGKVLSHPSAAQVPPPPELPKLDEADAPNELTMEERLVWLELAPHAMANGTLTTATALGFRMLCRNVALEKQYSQSVMDRGGPNHRGLIDKIDRELLRFGLSPSGKPVAAAPVAPAVDPRKERYFGRG